MNLTSSAAPAAPKAPAPKAPDSAVPALNTVEDVVSDLGATDELLPGELAPGLGLHLPTPAIGRVWRGCFYRHPTPDGEGPGDGRNGTRGRRVGCTRGHGR